MNCIHCGKALSAYDVGFFKKLVNRGAKECACIACTAKHFELTEERAWEMIRRFQKNGCTLFPPPEDEDCCI